MPSAPTLLPTFRRAPPAGRLTLASDLRVPLGWVRRHGNGRPDSGVSWSLHLVLASRPHQPTDLPAHPSTEMTWVVPAVLATPMLHAPIDMGALRSAFDDHLRHGLLPPPLGNVLLPRPPAAPLRRAVWPGAGWKEAAITALPRRRSLAVQQVVLDEHPGVLERVVLRDRAAGWLLAEAHDRSAVLGGTREGRPGTVMLPDLAAELALMCPDGNEVRRQHPQRPRPRRGESAAEAERWSLAMVAQALTAGDHQDAVVRAGKAWQLAVRDNDAYKSTYLAENLRTDARKGLRQLHKRADQPRITRRQVQPYMVADLRSTARPFPAALLWSAGGSEDALVSSAELLRDALRMGDVRDALRMAVGGDLEGVQWSPLWSSGWEATCQQPMVVAQVVMDASHPLHRRAVGAMPMEDPRSMSAKDWKGLWCCPERRLQQSRAELSQRVVATLAGPAASAEVLVRTVWGDASWPIHAGFAVA